MNILDEIVLTTKETLSRRKKQVPVEKLLAGPFSFGIGTRTGFKATLSVKGMHLIAELKKSSPSSGELRKDFNVTTLARSFEEAGASCLSVLTEEKYFSGSLDYLDEVRKTVSLPLLRKDFIVDEYQVHEARFHGADAILLIASILSVEELNRLSRLALSKGLDVLLEVHTEADMEKIGAAPEAVIGINTRNLKDLSVDLQVLPVLMKKIPAGRLVICESGIKDTGDLALVKAAGVRGVLVGSSLMSASEPGALAKEFVSFLASFETTGQADAS